CGASLQQAPASDPAASPRAVTSPRIHLRPPFLPGRIGPGVSKPQPTGRRSRSSGSVAVLVKPCSTPGACARLFWDPPAYPATACPGRSPPALAEYSTAGGRGSGIGGRGWTRYHALIPDPRSLTPNRHILLVQIPPKKDRTRVQHGWKSQWFPR